MSVDNQFTPRHAALATPRQNLPRPTSPSNDTNRLEFLDALRGLAAIFVLLHHVYQTSPLYYSHETHPILFNIVRFTPLRILLNGRPSVIFFFVLSGYVLAHGIWMTSRPQSMLAYAARRCVRIYIPYAVGGCVALALLLIVGTSIVTDLGDTFNDMWGKPVSSHDVINYFLLSGTASANRLDTPAWSLVYEIRISIFMPLLCALYVWRPAILATASILVFLAMEVILIATGVGLTPFAGAGVFQNLAITAHFTAFFVLGMVLCRASLNRSVWLRAPTMSQRRILVLTATCLLLIMRDAAIAIGAALTIYLCLTSPRARAALSHPILLFCGRISFSLYLTHMIVIEFFMRVTQGWLAVPAALSVATALAFVTAWLFFRCVERPSHHLAKWAGRLRVGRQGSRARQGLYGYLRPIPLVETR